jgi:VWFA-related protein
MKPGSRSRLQRIVSVFTAAGLALAPWSATAQTFSETTEVVVVEVPVQVIKDGEPVRGLTAADFELFDGRKKVEITGFEVLDLNESETAQANAEVPVAARRHFLMLFDLSNSEPKSIVKAREAAKGVVDGLHPTDLVSVATYSTLQGPQLVIGFTPDRRQIATAIDTLGLPQLVERSADPLRLILTATQREVGTRPAGDASQPRADARNEALAGREEALVDTLETLTASSERADRNAQQQTLRTMTKSLTDLARLMAEVEGRKYVVFLSEGFDATLLTGKGPAASEDLLTQVDAATSDDRITAPTGGTGSDEQFGDTRSQNAVEKMLDEFRRADCQIQAVDLGGLRAGGEQGFARKNGREALFNMAKSTGGELYENTNNINALMGQMLRRTGVTYVLSFQPDKLKTDGSFHRLKVELKGQSTRGARPVFRTGYYAPRPFKEQPVMQRLLETANEVMGEESGSIATSVLATPFAAAGDRAQVPVVVEVDGPTLLAGKQGAQLPVEIYIYAMDKNGAVQDFITQTVGLDLTKAEPMLRQTGLKFFGHLELPPGDYSLRTLVRNGATGTSSLQVTELNIPAYSAGQPALLPPVFQDAAPARWVNLRQTKKEGQPEPPYLFMIKEQPYVPTTRPGQDARLVLQGYNLGAGDWKAEAKVFSADGKEVPGATLQMVDKEAGSGAKPTRMVASFRPPNLPPGQYELRVTLTDSAGKSQTTTSRFSVGGAAGTRGGR